VPWDGGIGVLKGDGQDHALAGKDSFPLTTIPLYFPLTRCGKRTPRSGLKTPEAVRAASDLTKT
jgi:hypothetical protein